MPALIVSGSAARTKPAPRDKQRASGWELNSDDDTLMNQSISFAPNQYNPLSYQRTNQQLMTQAKAQKTTKKSDKIDKTATEVATDGSPGDNDIENFNTNGIAMRTEEIEPTPAKISKQSNLKPKIPHISISDQPTKETRKTRPTAHQNKGKHKPIEADQKPSTSPQDHAQPSKQEMADEQPRQKRKYTKRADKWYKGAQPQTTTDPTTQLNKDLSAQPVCKPSGRGFSEDNPAKSSKTTKKKTKQTDHPEQAHDRFDLAIPDLTALANSSTTFRPNDQWCDGEFAPTVPNPSESPQTNISKGNLSNTKSVKKHGSKGKLNTLVDDNTHDIADQVVEVDQVVNKQCSFKLEDPLGEDVFDQPASYFSPPRSVFDVSSAQANQNHLNTKPSAKQVLVYNHEKFKSYQYQQRQLQVQQEQEEKQRLDSFTEFIQINHQSKFINDLEENYEPQSQDDEVHQSNPNRFLDYPQFEAIQDPPHSTSAPLHQKQRYNVESDEDQSNNASAKKRKFSSLPSMSRQSMSTSAANADYPHDIDDKTRSKRQREKTKDANTTTHKPVDDQQFVQLNRPSHLPPLPHPRGRHGPAQHARQTHQSVSNSPTSQQFPTQSNSFTTQSNHGITGHNSSTQLMSNHQAMQEAQKSLYTALLKLIDTVHEEKMVLYKKVHRAIKKNYDVGISKGYSDKTAMPIANNIRDYVKNNLNSIAECELKFHQHTQDLFRDGME